MNDLTENTRRCPKCGRVLPKSEFYPKGKGLQSWCKDCCKSHGRLRNGTTGIYRKEITDMKDLVFKGENGLALTNSLLVAEKFGKNHRDVLEAVRRMLTTAENSAVLRMFVESHYVNEQNREQPMFIMNRDGFTLLAMGFTGKRAMQFKLEYIAAFNSMEKSIRQAQEAALPPKSGAELMLMYAQQMVMQERKLLAIENKTQEQEKRLIEIEARINSTVPYTTIVGFGNRYGLRIPLEKASALGRIATNLCKRCGFEMGKVQDPRFGWVKTYPDAVLAETFQKEYKNIKF